MTNVQYDLKFEITYFNKHYGIPCLAKEYIFSVRYFSRKLKITVWLRTEAPMSLTDYSDFIFNKKFS